MASTFDIPAMNLPERVVTQTDGGLSVITSRLPHLPLVSFRMLLPRGAAADAPEKQGLQRFAARLLKQGAGRYSAEECAYEIERRGAMLSVKTSHDAVIISGSFFAEDLTFGLEMLAEMLREPHFNESEIDRQRKKTIGEIRAVYDDPPHLNGLLHSGHIYSGHPYGRRIIGTEDTVAAFTRSDILQAFERNFRRRDAVMTIVGDFDEIGIPGLIDRLFPRDTGAADENTDIPSPHYYTGRRVIIVHKPDITQAHIRIGNTGPARNDADLISLKVASTVLGGSFTSRLNESVRVREGLTYGIRSAVAAQKSGGSVQIVTFTKNDTAGRAVELILSEMHLMSAASVPENELTDVKRYMTGLYPLSVETNKKLAQHLSDVYFYRLPEDYLDAYCTNMAAVPAEAVQRSSRKWLSSENCIITVLGNANELEDKLGRFGSVTVSHELDDRSNNQ